MIKQIQLRGISRTPSDRMSEDGGLSESLNMFMDTAENAPAFVPEDVTKDLKLPADLQAERIFIHKTANYENYIVVHRDKVVAYTPDIKDDEPLLVMDLDEGEEVNDITSLGNTLIVSTVKNMYYILFKDRKYSFMGNKIPFPKIDFKRSNITEFESVKASVSHDNYGGDFWFLDNAVYIPEESEWNTNATVDKEHTGKIRNCLDDLWVSINHHILLAEQKKGKLTSSIIIRYEVDVYGSSLSSMPILIPAPFGESLTAHISTLKESTSYNDGEDNREVLRHTSETIALSSAIQSYDIFAQLSEDWEYENWRDVITAIRIYISKPLDWGVLKYSTRLTNRITSGNSVDNDNYSYTSEGDVNFVSDPEYLEDILEISSQVFMVKEVPLLNPEGISVSDEFKQLLKGEILDIHKFIDSSKEDHTPLEDQRRMEQDDMKHYTLTSPNVNLYNNKLLLVQPTQVIDYDYHTLNSIDYVKTEPSDAWGKDTYNVTYLLKTNKEDKVIKKSFTYSDNDGERENIYAFQIFPDSRCYKMLIELVRTLSVGASGTTHRYYGEFDMHPHPYLDCAYYYGGISKSLSSECVAESIEDYPIDSIDETENKLILSEMDKPFIFPLTGRYTFQSKVIGVAVATTALSQGQFGQFPLYVFTEDGIWAMETAADGSFVTSKPLSREVCSNPDSITSIDNAVVFVTKKAVMMISGSQVANISAYMNGRHYIPNESAQNTIGRQEGFAEFIPAVTDEDPFMLFMQDAKVAYDYTGERLVFISPSNKDFQYVYKVDTQTWHKVAFEGLDLVQPLNSYPECLVLGVAKESFPEIYCTENMSSLDAYELLEKYGKYFGDDLTYLEHFLYSGERIPLYGLTEEEIINLQNMLEKDSVYTEIGLVTRETTCVYDLSTILDASRKQETAKGILITRPFDLGMPDVYKSITNIRIRGDYDKENVKWFLQGSENGRDFYTLTSLRGKSWKMFRIFILADLEPTERISWIDIDFEPRYNNRLR